MQSTQRDKLFVLSQHWLPKHALTRLAGWIANLEGGWLTTGIIKAFIRHFDVNMAEAQHPDPAHYATFNEFFTRPLRPGAREFCAGEQLLGCAVDGAVSQAGKLDAGRILQAKGHDYSLAELLGGDTARAADYLDGEFATIYLSPKDYHRIHMPMSGTLREMVYVPGELFSVNPATVTHLPGLFARNERLVCHFETAQGPMAMVLVGATIVGSMETVWAGVVNEPRAGGVQRWQYPAEGPSAVTLAKGEELGRFRLGSTIIQLHSKGKVQWAEQLQSGRAVRLGEEIGRFSGSES